MDKKNNEIIDIIRKLIKALKNKNIKISEAYLFGSYITNNNTEHSDIDVALISNEFTGVRYLDIKKIGRIVRNIDYRIEVHTFSENDKGKSMFLDEIIQKGIKVA